MCVCVKKLQEEYIQKRITGMERRMKLEEDGGEEKTMRERVNQTDQRSGIQK